ncbi:MAG: hypothetical protein EAX96_08325 [Candidatus Lokiarchaeota archaeon]|nr:hypothetical protein [Candidatus Lokiarchaeota archaeon]
MVIINFYLRDLPKDQQEKSAEVSLNDSIGKIKGIVRKLYSINQLYTITLMHFGEVLENEKQVKEYDLTNGKVKVMLIKTSDMREL